MNIFQSKLYKAIILLFGVIAIGVMGYMYLSDDTFINSLYMTVITMTTVGFGEVHPLSPEEKLFTIFLILMSVIIIGYAASILTEYIASGELLEKLKYKKDGRRNIFYRRLPRYGSVAFYYSRERRRR